MELLTIAVTALCVTTVANWLALGALLYKQDHYTRLLTELRESDSKRKDLAKELALWKIACDKLHKEMENGQSVQTK